VLYVLYSWGNNWIEFTIGANVATINGIIIYLFYKINCVWNLKWEKVKFFLYLN
jgi:hypothetical protein